MHACIHTYIHAYIGEDSTNTNKSLLLSNEGARSRARTRAHARVRTRARAMHAVQPAAGPERTARAARRGAARYLLTRRGPARPLQERAAGARPRARGEHEDGEDNRAEQCCLRGRCGGRRRVERLCFHEVDGTHELDASVRGTFDFASVRGALR